MSCLNFHSICRDTVALLSVLIATTSAASQEVWTFEEHVSPFLSKYCTSCHGQEEMESGIRVDQLDGELRGRRQFLWKAIDKHVAEESMPPEGEPQPTADERKALALWIDGAIQKSLLRDKERNGSARRLTVAQYRNTLEGLLGLKEDLTGVLPADGVSKDGFVNNGQVLLLSPLLVEAYFEIAEKALNLSIVDEESKPIIQHFRMQLGQRINPEPFPDRLILGANSHLLDNADHIVSEPRPDKPFDFEHFRMQRKFRFIEGYQGNDTVRGWRDYDSIYHAVFACMRGNQGYPKGLAYQTVPEGLLLRPAIPSREQFGVESTYGPRANFKISLRELPEQGNFRVTVRAAKYDDGLLLDPGSNSRPEPSHGAITVKMPTERQNAEPQSVEIEQAGVYQADVYLTTLNDVKPDNSRLQDALVGAWRFDGTATSEGEKELVGELTEGAEFVESPFKQALRFNGMGGAVVVPRDESMNIGEGEFTVAAWIHPRGLRQAGIVAAGAYGYAHGWLVDMPNGNGVLRIETSNSDNQLNGAVQSSAGAIANDRWSHVAVVVRRGENNTRLYVNGFEVGKGTINGANLDNPNLGLHIGRIPQADEFKGEIDEVHLYRRALDVAEIKALVEPGSQFVQPPATEHRRKLTLTLNNRVFSSNRFQDAFLAVRLPAGPLQLGTQYEGNAAIDRVVLTPLDETDDLTQTFLRFEQRLPRVGVYVGLRRDCGSTMRPVGRSQPVTGDGFAEYIFEGAINNYPSPDVEKDNVNYLAGVREIGVRSDFTDGRDLPRLVIQSIDFEGPFYKTWPPESHRNIFIDSPHRDDPAIYAREVIRNFATKAFRRPITTGEEAALFNVWKESFAESSDFNQSIKDALLVALTSPQFLFLIENSATPDPETLEAFELASKLSYFLWNAAPDERLLKLASENKLHDSLDSEIDRMIADPRFEQFTREFVSQWLSLDKFDVVSFDRGLYPGLTRDTKDQLREEPIRFVQHLIRENLPLRNLIKSDFILANDVVANYYSLGDRVESGLDFVVLEHGDERLGGILSQASILAGLSDGRHSNPIKRGAWFARKMIAEPPDDPPPNVPELIEDDGSLTLRQKLEIHRDVKGCANCHAGIDPWGLPFEEFNAGGLFKNDPKVDASSGLPDGTEVASLNDLKNYLANDRIDRVAFSFMKHLATYAVGRDLNLREIVFLEEEGLQLKAQDYRIQEMIRFVVTSDMFLKK